MTTAHVSQELLAMVLRGELPPSALLRLVREHQGEVCPHCAEALAALYRRLAEDEARQEARGEGGERRRELAGELAGWDEVAVGPEVDGCADAGLCGACIEGGPHLGSALGGVPLGEIQPAAMSGQRGVGTAAAEPEVYGPAFQRAAVRALRQTEAIHNAKLRARDDLRSLRGLGREAAVARIDGSPHRYRSLHLVSLLLTESRRRLEAEPGRAELCASLALDVLQRVPREEWDFRGDSLEIRARATVAHALRAAGDLASAAGAFRDLHRRLEEQPSDDPEVAAEVAWMEALLRRDERRFAEAQRLLSAAALSYRQAGRREGLAQAWIQKGVLHRLQEDPAAALVCFQQAQETAGRDEHPEPHLVALAYRAATLCDLGRPDEAAELVFAHRRLFERSRAPWGRARRLWLEGRCLLGQGRRDEAAERLGEARDDFLADGEDLHAQMVVLDLAVLHLEAGAWPELERLADALVTALAPDRLHQHEAAALVMLRRAVEARGVTAGALRRLQASLEHLHQELSFVSPA